LWNYTIAELLLLLRLLLLGLLLLLLLLRLLLALLLLLLLLLKSRLSLSTANNLSTLRIKSAFINIKIKQKNNKFVMT